jgi:hypothetical protein
MYILRNSKNGFLDAAKQARSRKSYENLAKDKHGLL